MRTLRVLVPLDGSPLSEAILPSVCGVAPTAVTLARILAPGAAATPAHLEEELRLVSLAERLRAAGIAEVRSLSRYGTPADEILELAKELDVGLLAMTTHGRGGFDRLVHGSVAEKVIRAAAVPVLAVRATGPAGDDVAPARLFEHVLVPYDGSPTAWRAVETLGLLGAAGKGRLLLYGVVESDEPGPPVGAPAPHDIAGQHLRLLRDGMRDRLGHAVARARDLGFDARADLDVGRIASRVLDQAERHAATLIAMGAHGRSGLSRWALGSVTESVLRASTAPVLICK